MLRLLPSLRLVALLVPLALLTTGAGSPGRTALKGIALADWGHMPDMAALDADWYYGWGQHCTNAARAQGCVDMVREWQLPNACYPYLLVGNEPTNAEPAGHPMSATEAATRTVAIETMCPNTWIVAGNQYPYVLGLEWFADYLAAYKVAAGKPYSKALGMHCYTAGGDNAADLCIAAMTQGLALYSGEWWLTEFNCLWDCSAAEFQQLLDWTGRHFTRVAPYTNRQPCTTNCGWVLYGADLVNANGTLTPKGAAYAAWIPPTMRDVWLPLVRD